MGGTSVACYVRSSGGDGSSNIGNSYGKSPYTDWDAGVHSILPSGNVLINDYNHGVDYSYGSPVTTISDFTQIIYPNGILNNGSYGVDNSYGSSPNIDYVYSWIVSLIGDTDFNSFNVYGSYGSLRSRVIPTVYIV